MMFSTSSPTYADEFDDFLDEQFAAGRFTRAAIDASTTALESGKAPWLALAMAHARESVLAKGGNCALCGRPIKIGQNAKMIAANVPYQENDSHVATTVRTFCAGCYVDVQRSAAHA